MSEINTWCPCGRPIINGKCSRKHPIKACKGGQAEKRPKYRGRSKFFEYQGKDFNNLGYAK